MPFNLLNGPSGPTFGAPNSAGGGTAPTITSPAFLVDGTVGTVYPTTTFTATGSPTITWSVTAGTLPTGMSFSSGGVLSGTPTATASGSITFTATNAFGSANRPLTFTVNTAGTSPNYVVALDDWSTGSAVPVGTLTLNVDNGVINPQDSTLAAHYSGGIQTWRSASSIIHGPAGEQFEFGAMMFTVTNGAFDNTDLYQVLVGCKPYGRWATYPYMDTFNRNTDVTHPAPFKIRILNGSGTLVKTIEMRDGLPVNHASLSQIRSNFTFVPNTATRTNPFTTTNGSSIVTVNSPSHGRQTGDVVKFFDAVGFNGLSSGTLNQQLYITVVDANNYTVNCGVNATAPGSGGGSVYIEEYLNGGTTGSPADNADNTAPVLRPFFNCGMLLPWQNKRPKALTTARQKIPQFAIDTYRQSLGKQSYSSNPPIPMLGYGGAGVSQPNGGNQLHFMTQWPLPPRTYGNSTWSSSDPYMPSPTNISAGRYTGGGAYRDLMVVSGWDYEPGSISGHDWLCGPGGSRFDRWQIPSPAAYYLSDPTWVHPGNGAAIVDINTAYGIAYFNHSCHYLTNVKTFETILNTKAEIFTRAYYNSYYGQNTFYNGGDATTHVNLLANQNSDYNSGKYTDTTQRPAILYDKNGVAGARRFWNGWATDGAHAHQFPGIWSYGFGSPMHMVGLRQHFNAASLSQTNLTSPTSYWGGAIYGYYGTNMITATSMLPFTYGGSARFTRDTAYRWQRLVWMWLNANNHASKAFGISRALVDELWTDEFAAAKSLCCDPIDAAVSTSPWARTFKNLGANVEVFENAGNYYCVMNQTVLGFYLGQLFVVMKTSGVWDYLRANVTNATAVLDWFFGLLCKQSIDFAYEDCLYFEFSSGDGQARNSNTSPQLFSTFRYAGGPYQPQRPVLTVAPHASSTFGFADTPASWAAVRSNITPETGEGFFKFPANLFTGSISGTTLTVTAVAKGVIFTNDFITSGAAVGTKIGSQLTGTTNGVGTYSVDRSQTVSSTSMQSTPYGEKYGSMYLRHQWAHAVRYWFTSEMNALYGSSVKTDAAIAAYQSALTDWATNKIDPQATPVDKTNNDSAFLLLPAHRMRTPTEVGL